jgi:GTP cyclohydrolase I
LIDIQAAAGSGHPAIAIASVGVTGLSYPIVALDAATGESQRSAADWRLGVALPAEQRGTHMSRFLSAVHEASAAPLSLDGVLAMTQALVPRLAAPVAEMSVAFSWYREMKAPVSQLTSLAACRVTYGATAPAHGDATKTLTIAVPAKALCPCSKAISERGAHNQRSDVTVSMTLAADATTWAINRVITAIEASASAALYPLLKREDEKFITEFAYDNPVFVEDIVRNAAERLSDAPGIKTLVVEAINRESIHAHDCFARVVVSR